MKPRPIPIATPVETRSYMRVLLGRHRARFAIIVALTVGAALAAMVTPYLVGLMADSFAEWAQGENADPGSDLGPQIGTILAALLAQAALAWAAFKNLTILTEWITADVREEFLERTLALPSGEVEAAGTGELLSRTSLDVGQVQHSLINDVPRFFTGLVTTLVYLAGAFWVSPLLGLAVLVAVPPMVPVLNWYFKRASRAFHAVQAARADMTAAVAETIDGLKTVEALGWQRRRVDITDRAVDRLYEGHRRTIGLRRVLFPVLDCSAFLPVLTVLVVGGLLTASGRVGLAETTTVVLIMQLAVAPMIEMILSLEGVQIGSVSLARLVGVRAGSAARGEATPDRESEEIIELKNVEFGYSADKPVLFDVHLSLRRGERLALVGPTGAGKSTLARLLAGVHIPDRGTVRHGGVDVREVDESTLRRFVVLATQEFHLFNDTLAANLRLGAAAASESDLREALAVVGADGLLSRVEGDLETRVGGRDHELTPAEVQQVALARVVLASPEVIVLDEATSMSNAGTAGDIERSLDRVLAGRTVVSIAHRLSTAQVADRIAVVERGRIVEVGSHDELLANNGEYASYWRRWRDRAE